MGETSEYFTDWNESYESFDQMNLHENLLRGIYAYGASRLLRRARAGGSRRLHFRAVLAGGCWPTDLIVSSTAVVRLMVAPARCRTASCRLDASLEAPASAGFEKPSAIQQKGIVPFGKGLDVIQQAQSGTGKTATFCAGILQVGADLARLPLLSVSASWQRCP